MKRFFWALVALGLAALLLVTLALQPEPAVVSLPGPAVTERIHQAQAALRRNDPRGAPPGPRQLNLSQSELEWVLDFGLARWRPGQSQVRLTPEVAELRVSVELPFPAPWRWMNLHTQWREAPEHSLWPSLEQARIGRLPLPAPLSGWLLHQAARRALGEHDLQTVRGMVRGMSFHPGRVQVRYDWRADSVQQLTGRFWPAADQARFQAYQTRLQSLSAQVPSGSPVPLAPWLQDLMQLATQRSGGQAEQAAAEQRALFLTLGLYASGHGWDRFIPQARTWPRPQPVVLILSGREDFALHLLISAVLAIEGGGPVTDAIGLYKEIADTRGGSGFSFNDLAADLAGKRLGLLSQQDPLKLGRLAAAGVQESHFMPSVADLPEFLTEAQLRQQFGGPGGPGYQAVMRRIEERVGALPWFR